MAHSSDMAEEWELEVAEDSFENAGEVSCWYMYPILTSEEFDFNNFNCQHRPTIIHAAIIRKVFS